MAENGTTHPSSLDKEYVSHGLIALMRSVSCVIIVLNFAVLVCLTRERRKFPNSYWLQIVCITCNDILAGASSFIMSFVDWPFFGEHIIPCCFTVGFFITTQCATLYNILAICINRFIVLKGLKRSENLWKNKHTIYGTMAAWVCSIGLCSAPIIIWADPENFSKARFCSMKGMFGEHADSVMQVLLGSFLVPLILTDVIYSIVFLVLKRELKIVRASGRSDRADSTSSSHLGSRGEFRYSVPSLLEPDGEENNKKTFRCQGIQTELSLRLFTKSRIIEPSTDNFMLTSDDLPPNVPGLDEGDLSNGNEDGKSSYDVSRYLENDKESDGGLLDNKSDGIGGSMIDEQSNISPVTHRISVPIIRIRRAFVLLGCILIALNILTWPGLGALVLGSKLGSSYFSRSLILPLFSSLSLNSVVNPILYTVRIPEFRDAFCHIFCFKSNKRRRKP